MIRQISNACPGRHKFPGRKRKKVTLFTNAQKIINPIHLYYYVLHPLKYLQYAIILSYCGASLKILPYFDSILIERTLDFLVECFVLIIDKVHVITDKNELCIRYLCTCIMYQTRGFSYIKKYEIKIVIV
jgi:hypothetical protein